MKNIFDIFPHHYPNMFTIYEWVFKYFPFIIILSLFPIDGKYINNGKQ